MYRAVALAVIESTMNEHDDVAVGDLAERIEIDLEAIRIRCACFWTVVM
jgi:hypothetical protein